MLNDILINLLSDLIFVILVGVTYELYWKKKLAPFLRSARKQIKMISDHEAHGFCDGCAYVKSMDYWTYSSDKQIRDYFGHLKQTGNVELTVLMKDNMKAWIKSRKDSIRTS